MNLRKTSPAFSALAGLLLLSACGQGGEAERASEDSADAGATTLPNGMTVKEQIEARQGQLEKIGESFKTISDQLKSDSPDVAAIQAAAASVPENATGMADWFAEGTGPDSGVETDALPIIWEEKDDFLAKVTAMQEAAVALVAATEGGDVAAIGAAFRETGGTCKACHDKYRLDD
ncbi:Cytochrome c556 [Parasphingorhabdus marina DSM 22363]|uniref:Cytochrome c556 n=1 Tax=Parasphingorhabdus marina DSM 22363 TaxID=1123272 RepID=A0A1N6FWS0_9SPHN|nr:cytochrome c [Parasphingorhabdus marina]SIN99693.1 Cytochrome c556 [Parasphingorhabdus marina DSM 22363]